jgi:hypothetical protein
LEETAPLWPAVRVADRGVKQVAQLLANRSQRPAHKRRQRLAPLVRARRQAARQGRAKAVREPLRPFVIATTIEMEGTLEADGQLVLDEKPALPPGRVWGALRTLVEGAPRGERLPDAAWLDAAISAPFDLPHGDVMVRVEPRPFPERLPEILTPAEDAE